MRLLVVCYAFPPAGGVTVLRVTKLVKHLPSFGVQPIVLTAENPSVPLFDPTLSGDVPESVRVVRTRTLEPGYGVKNDLTRGAPNPGFSGLVKKAAVRVLKNLALPDPQILWLPTAAPAFSRLSREVDAVLVSGPPFSPFLLGPLSRAPFVLDYRDEWRTAAAFDVRQGLLAPRFIDSVEPALVRRAAKVLTATEAFRQNLLARYEGLSPRDVVTLPNGYDPEDFSLAREAPPPPAYSPGQKLILTHAGTTFRLTSPRGLVAALRLLEERAPDVAAMLDVRFIGRIVETEKDIFDCKPLQTMRVFPHLPHKEALTELQKSHVALCILDDTEGAKDVYPSKIFEIMHMGKPCLTLAPEGALARLASRHGLGLVVHPRDTVAIAEALEKAVSAFRRGEPLLPFFQPVGVEQYERRAIAEKLAGVLHEIAGSKASISAAS